MRRGHAACACCSLVDLKKLILNDDVMQDDATLLVDCGTWAVSGASWYDVKVKVLGGPLKLLVAFLCQGEGKSALGMCTDLRLQLQVNVIAIVESTCS